MGTILMIVLVIVAFIAGVLVGRANPKKADKLAEIADDLKEKAKDKIDEYKK